MDCSDCKDIKTQIVRGYQGFDKETGAISYPIYQSATFRHNALNDSTGYDYSRLKNPTRNELENTVALLEGGKRGFAFSSGMAAITNVIKLFEKDAHIIVSEDLYGGTFRLFNEIYSKYGMTFSYIDTANISLVRETINDKTKAIFIETPSNPMMTVTDISEVVKISKEFNLLTIVDNTFLSPYFQRPITLGADIVIHSGTKFLSGHNDVVSGFVVAATEELCERLYFYQNSEGATLGPFESWLMLRGIKTLAIRMDKQQENAIKIAEHLLTKKDVEQVYYVGLKGSKGYEINCKQATGFGSMISFKVKSREKAEHVINSVKLIYFAESLGGVESLITYPCTQTHAAIPKEIRERVGVDDRLLRLSVGIESVEDLIKDLDSVLD